MARLQMRKRDRESGRRGLGLLQAEVKKEFSRKLNKSFLILHAMALRE
jgi:hypothetical protein